MWCEVCTCRIDIDPLLDPEYNAFLCADCKEVELIKVLKQLEELKNAKSPDAL